MAIRIHHIIFTGLVLLTLFTGWGLFINYTLDKIDPSGLNKCLTTKMNQIYLCPTNENYVKLQDTSYYFIQALLISEDVQFFDHHGFDFYEIRESFFTNLKRMRLSRGGSTLTQQLVKNVFLSTDKSINRKVLEALLVRRIEKQFSKEVLLEKYINVVEFGPKLFGVKKASRYYFNKSPAQLNALEAAFLVYLLPNPKVYSRVYDKSQLTEFSTKRLNTILKKLYVFKRIKKSTYNGAKSEVQNFPWIGLNLPAKLYRYEYRKGFFAKGESPLVDDEVLEEHMNEEEIIDSAQGEIDDSEEDQEEGKIPGERIVEGEGEMDLESPGEKEGELADIPPSQEVTDGPEGDREGEAADYKDQQQQAMDQLKSNKEDPN